MPNGSPSQRAYVRIPVSLPAEIALEDQTRLKGQVTDLSTAGLALQIATDVWLPDVFAVTFKLPRYSQPVTVFVEVKNRLQLADGTRLGCVFASCEDGVKDQIDGFVSRYLNISFPLEMINIAALICAMDACTRGLFFCVNWYFSRTPFGLSAPEFSPALGYYLLFSVTAFVLSLRPAVMKFGSASLIGALMSLAYAAAFLAWKESESWRAGFGEMGDRVISGLVNLQLLEIALTVAALCVGLVFYRKIIFVGDVIRNEFRAQTARR